MSVDPAGKLVAMGNQIADYFRPYPHEQAVKGIRNHIHAFWTPKMRATLRVDAPGLDPLVRDALNPDLTDA